MKTLTLLLLNAALLFGLDALTLKLRIMGELARLVTQKEVPTIYLDDGSDLRTLQKSGLEIRFTRKCDEADVFFTHRFETLQAQCPLRKHQKVFSLSYRDYIRHTDREIGAFFWQKGRPNIILNGTLIRRLKIAIPDRYEKYVE